MKSVYYNQNNYASVPYPSSSLTSATVKSGGCGVCCGAMIVSSMADTIVDPKAMAAYSIAKGARVSGGTDMTTLAKAICADYALAYETTSDESKLLQHLSSGGMAVCNVGGDRSGYVGVFSDGGHFIVAAGVNGNTITIMDPGYYTGKFNKTGRSGKVTVSGNYYYCDISVLATDTSNRNPAYTLFSKRKEAAKDMKIGMEIPEVKVTLNGKAMAKTVILNIDGKDTTYIPAVSLRDAGLSVDWDAANSTVIIKGGK